ncbi:MAG: glycosyltransferase, partial [Clostridia bacterium]
DKVIECINNKKYFKLIKEIFKGLKIIYLKYTLMNKEIKNVKTDYIFSTRIEFSKLIKRKDTINISQEHSYINTKKYITKVKKSFNFIDYVIVMTNNAKLQYDKWIKKDIVVIPNMINENSKYSTLENKQIISIGRLEEEKDFITLINIFKNIQKKYPDWILKIVGEGSKKEELINLINSYNLQDKVIFTGVLNDDEIKNEMLQSSIFVSTSKTESFSLVLCEAMNYGIPVISFDIDVGPREIIDNEINGYLIENRNLNKMKDKIIELIDNKELRKKIGNNASIKAKTFYPSNVINKWKELLERWENI